MAKCKVKFEEKFVLEVSPKEASVLWHILNCAHMVDWKVVLEAECIKKYAEVASVLLGTHGDHTVGLLWETLNEAFEDADINAEGAILSHPVD